MERMKHTPPHSYSRHPADSDHRDEEGLDAELSPAEQEELGSRGADDTPVGGDREPRVGPGSALPCQGPR